jgi:L-asparaginase II
MSKLYPSLKVEVVRGQLVESFHEVAAIVVGEDGKVVAAYGDPDQVVFPRSALKPFQTFPLLATGTAQALNFSDKEVALACASHSGEDEQVQVIAKLLQRLGLRVSDLECGVHPPSHLQSANELILRREAPTALHNNCSGKHVGMLATAIHFHEPIHGYSQSSHPVQIRVRAAIEAICGVTLAPDKAAIDGCALPAYMMSLRALASGVQRLTNPRGLEPEMQFAAARILKSALEHPYFIAGSGKYCTEMMKLLDRNALIKTGAEGIMIAAFPTQKLALALKVKDGNIRASEAATTYLMSKLLPAKLAEKITPFQKIETKNWNGQVTGFIECVGVD